MREKGHGGTERERAEENLVMMSLSPLSLQVLANDHHDEAHEISDSLDESIHTPALSPQPAARATRAAGMYSPSLSLFLSLLSLSSSLSLLTSSLVRSILI